MSDSWRSVDEAELARELVRVDSAFDNKKVISECHGDISIVFAEQASWCSLLFLIKTLKCLW